MRDYGVYEHPTFFVVDKNGEENLGRYDRRVNSEVATDCFSGSVTGQRMVGETLYFLNTDGVDIDGFVMKPVGYEPGTRYPGILHIHGGPKMVFGPGFHHEMQLWAASGFFVCYCNPRGSCGKGNAFADLQGKYGEVDFRDLMEFTDEVLRRYPEIDADRMGVAGGSYGGFMTNWVIGHTDRFRCAVSQRSIANYVGDYLLSDIGYYLEAVFFTWRFQRTAATAPRHTGIAEALRREPTFSRRWALAVSTRNEMLYFLSNRMNSRLDRHSRKG